MADTPNASGEPGELYLDAAATESVSPAVIEAMTPFLTEAYANPASVHQPGKTAARALDAARASFAAALGARPDDVIFTSGGTESDNLAIKGIAMARMRKLGLRPVCGFAEKRQENYCVGGNKTLLRCKFCTVGKRSVRNASGMAIKKISPWERNKSSGWCYRKPKFHISKPNIPLMVKNSPRQLAPISG